MGRSVPLALRFEKPRLGPVSFCLRCSSQLLLSVGLHTAVWIMDHTSGTAGQPQLNAFFYKSCLAMASCHSNRTVTEMALKKPVVCYHTATVIPEYTGPRHYHQWADYPHVCTAYTT